MAAQMLLEVLRQILTGLNVIFQCSMTSKMIE